MKSDGSNHSCKHNGLLNTFSYTSHLVNANKKLKTPLTSKDMSHLGKLYMTLFERLEPQSESRTMAASQRCSLDRRYATGEKGQTLPGTFPTCSVATPLTRGVSSSGQAWGAYPPRDTAHTSADSSNRTCHSCRDGTVFAAWSARIPGT